MLILRTLGESVFEIGATRIAPNAPHLFGALLYLGLERGRGVPRVTLQQPLFPEADHRGAAHSVGRLL